MKTGSPSLRHPQLDVADGAFERSAQAHDHDRTRRTTSPCSQPQNHPRPSLPQFDPPRGRPRQPRSAAPCPTSGRKEHIAFGDPPSLPDHPSLPTGKASANPARVDETATGGMSPRTTTSKSVCWPRMIATKPISAPATRPTNAPAKARPRPRRGRQKRSASDSPPIAVRTTIRVAMTHDVHTATLLTTPVALVTITPAITDNPSARPMPPTTPVATRSNVMRCQPNPFILAMAGPDTIKATWSIKARAGRIMRLLDFLCFPTRCHFPTFAAGFRIGLRGWAVTRMRGSTSCRCDRPLVLVAGNRHRCSHERLMLYRKHHSSFQFEKPLGDRYVSLDPALHPTCREPS